MLSVVLNGSTVVAEAAVCLAFDIHRQYISVSRLLNGIYSVSLSGVVYF